MYTSGIYITFDHLKSLSNEQRTFLFNLIGGEDGFAQNPRPQTEEPNVEAHFNDPHFAELSPGQAREFYAGCNDKTRKAIEIIARSSDRFFQLADVAKAVGVAAHELKGVWSGLTRRTRTITGDHEAYLIDWAKSEPIVDDDGNYIDQRGEVAGLTYDSFRKALGIS